MGLRKISQFTETDHAIVVAAVADAERLTTGEIVTIVTDLSDHYDDIAMAWASAIAFIALVSYATFPEFYMGLIDSFSGGWRHEYTTEEYAAFLLAAVALKWIGTWFILKWMPLRFALTPKAKKLARVRSRANVDVIREDHDDHARQRLTDRQEDGVHLRPKLGDREGATRNGAAQASVSGRGEGGAVGDTPLPTVTPN